MSRYIVVYTLFLGLLLSACSSVAAPAPEIEAVGEQVSVSGGTYTDISVSELQANLENKDFTFVNVHIPFEGDITNTNLSIPYDEIEQNLGLLPEVKDAKIVLYCRSGRMSSIAAETLVGLGYTNVWNLDGGMIAWEQAGLPVKR